MDADASELLVRVEDGAAAIALRASADRVQAYAEALSRALDGIARVGWATTKEDEPPASVADRAWNSVRADD